MAKRGPDEMFVRVDGYDIGHAAHELTMEVAAEIEHDHRALGHTMRRRWVTRRQEEPTKAVAEAGGWRDESTMVRAYQIPDHRTIRRVVETPTHRVRAAEQ